MSREPVSSHPLSGTSATAPLYPPLSFPAPPHLLSLHDVASTLSRWNSGALSPLDVAGLVQALSRDLSQANAHIESLEHALQEQVSDIQRLERLKVRARADALVQHSLHRTPWTLHISNNPDSTDPVSSPASDPSFDDAPAFSIDIPEQLQEAMQDRTYSLSSDDDDASSSSPPTPPHSSTPPPTISSPPHPSSLSSRIFAFATSPFFSQDPNPTPSSDNDAKSRRVRSNTEPPPSSRSVSANTSSTKHVFSEASSTAAASLQRVADDLATQTLSKPQMKAEETLSQPQPQHSRSNQSSGTKDPHHHHHHLPANNVRPDDSSSRLSFASSKRSFSSALGWASGNRTNLSSATSSPLPSPAISPDIPNNNKHLNVVAPITSATSTSGIAVQSNNPATTNNTTTTNQNQNIHSNNFATGTNSSVSATPLRHQGGAVEMEDILDPESKPPALNPNGLKALGLSFAARSGSGSTNDQNNMTGESQSQHPRIPSKSTFITLAGGKDLTQNLETGVDDTVVFTSYAGDNATNVPAIMNTSIDYLAPSVDESSTQRAEPLIDRYGFLLDASAGIQLFKEARHRMNQGNKPPTNLHTTNHQNPVATNHATTPAQASPNEDEDVEGAIENNDDAKQDTSSLKESHTTEDSISGGGHEDTSLAPSTVDDSASVISASRDIQIDDSEVKEAMNNKGRSRISSRKHTLTASPANATTTFDHALPIFSSNMNPNTGNNLPPFLSTSTTFDLKSPLSLRENHDLNMNTTSSTTSSNAHKDSLTSPIERDLDNDNGGPSSNHGTQSIKRLLTQLGQLNDSLEKTQLASWDAFIKKRKRNASTGAPLSNANSGAQNHSNSSSNTKDGFGAGVGDVSISSSNLPAPLTSRENTSNANNLNENRNDNPEEDDDAEWTDNLIGVAQMGTSGRKGKKEWTIFKKLVKDGIPPTYRPKIWAECSGASEIREPGLYQELLAAKKVGNTEEARCLQQIELDCHRTFPTNIFFGGDGPGVAKLRRVLTAYSRRKPDVGYCQGMNMVAAILLLTCPTEEDAFWIFCCIIERILPPSYYSSRLIIPQVDQRVLKDLVGRAAPRIMKHVEKLEVDLAAVTFGWFLSLFCDGLPIQTLLRVWDVLMISGSVVIFRVAVALLKLHSKEILAQDNAANMYLCLRTVTNHTYMVEKLFKVAFEELESIRNDDIVSLREKHMKTVQEELGITSE